MTTCLHEFTKAIISHAANDAKVTEAAVKMTYDNLQAHIKDDEGARAALSDEYIATHDAPRKDHEFTYITYMSEQAQLQQNWKSTRSIGALRKLLAHKMSESMLSFKPSSIYTQYAMPHDDY